MNYPAAPRNGISASLRQAAEYQELRSQNSGDRIQKHPNGFLISLILLDSDSWLLDALKYMTHSVVL